MRPIILQIDGKNTAANTKTYKALVEPVAELVEKIVPQTRYGTREPIEAIKICIGCGEKDPTGGHRLSAAVYGGPDRYALLVSFILSPYPACCGMKQLNHFISHGDINQIPGAEEWFDRVMCKLLGLVLGPLDQVNEPRFAINLILLGQSVKTAEEEESLIKDAPTAWAQQAHYPAFHRWVASKRVESAAYVYNRNSGNIIKHILFNLK